MARKTIYFCYSQATGRISIKFQTIIAAINLEDDLARGVLATAIALAKRDDAKLWVVDVWMPLRYAMATGISDPLGATAMIPSAADL